ncbi:MAG: FAD-binding protein, partial [Muribaculaceae bacterium]|nr:FAD-binding protein [Muribaculaceae bacterium]
FPGDTVVKANMDGDKIRAVYTVNHGDEPLEADNYMLASGSFFGNGLVALPDRIIEPVLGLDVEAPGLRAEWYKPDLYDAQPFMAFGVKSDESFRPSLDGRTISNLYAVGSILGGCNPIKEGCGAGVAILTAMFAADKILE